MAANESIPADLIEEPSSSNWNEIITNYARKTNGYNLPITLPRTEISSLTPDVIFWLVELRHNTGDVPAPEVGVTIREEPSDQVLPESDPDHSHANIHRYLEECVFESHAQNKSNSESTEAHLDDLNTDIEYSNTDGEKSGELCFYQVPQEEIFQEWEGLRIPKISFRSTDSSVGSLLSYSNTTSDVHSMASRPSLSWELNPNYSKHEEKLLHELKSMKPNGNAPILHPRTRDNGDGLSYKEQEDSLVELRGPRQIVDIEDTPTVHVLNRENNYGADSPSLDVGEKKKSVLNIKCENILSNLDEMIKKFEDIQDNNSTGGNLEALLNLRDTDFVKMCETADNIIEETLKLHVDSVKGIKDCQVTGSKLTVGCNRTSELSDDVFIDQEVTNELPTQEPHSSVQGGQQMYDVNEIFDRGSGGKPPVPPRRKKKTERLIPSGGEENIDEEAPMTHHLSTDSTNTEETSDKPMIPPRIVRKLDAEEIKPVRFGENEESEAVRDQKIINCKTIVLDYSPVIKKPVKLNDLVPHRSFTKLNIPTPEDCQVGKTSNNNFENPERKSSDVSEPDLKIHLTPTRPISSITFPPYDNPRERSDSSNSAPIIEKTAGKSSSPENKSHVVRTVEIKAKTEIDSPTSQINSSISKLYSKSPRNSNIYILPSTSTNDGVQFGKYTKLEETLPTTSQEDESIERLRKGSNASDITAWKHTLHTSVLNTSEITNTSSYYHDDEMDPTSMESREWFSSQDTDISGSLCSVNDTLSRSPSLPSITVATCEDDPETPNTGKSSIANMLETLLRNKQSQNSPRARSMLAVSSSMKIYTDGKTELVPEIWSEQTEVLQEGLLCRTKILENGKKVRKNWTKSCVVLTKTYLLFLKDFKTYHAMKMNADASRPDMVLDLCGANIERDEKLSSRKNTFAVSSSDATQVLLQAPTSLLSDQWYNVIATAIRQLVGQTVSGSPSPDGRVRANIATIMADSLDETKSSPLLQRSRSLKREGSNPKKEESTEDLAKSVEERQTKTKARLKNFFNKRPTKEFLVRKGIYKDEPMFGRELSEVVQDCIPAVPVFVSNCIEAIERKDENMKTDGLYRASGNLSQVQKIRLQVDQNCLSVLDDEEDVHVLTGVLKLFFRELKKPLIPFQMFHRAIAASALQSQKERIRQFRDLVSELPIPNHDTLEYLLQHLLRVTDNKEFNRMHIPNIAIVFGPTLMWPEQESLNMALDLMKQNLVIERLLVDYEDIFQ